MFARVSARATMLHAARVWKERTTVCRIFRCQLQLARYKLQPRSLNSRLSGTTGVRALRAPCERRRSGRTPGSKHAGGHRIRVTPVPIPNTEVKPDTADGTVWETVWESRSLPALSRAARELRFAGCCFVRLQRYVTCGFPYSYGLCFFQPLADARGGMGE